MLEEPWQVYTFYHKRKARDGKEIRKTEAWCAHIPTGTKLVVMGPGAVAACERAKEWFAATDHTPAFPTHIAADHATRASRSKFHLKHTFKL